MGVRSALAGTLTRAANAIAPYTTGGADTQPLAGPGPAAMRGAAAGAAAMGTDRPFAPGEPIRPFDGFSRYPRTQDFVTGYNIATRPRTHERVSFDVLKNLIDNYDFAQICIWHRIDSIRSLDWKLVAADWYSGDTSDAVARGMAALRKPDGVNDFETWFAKWAWDVLAYDAGALYRMRNRAGRCVGLLPVDGTTIAPLLDYWGQPPAPPAEAYVQYVNGLPWNWLTRKDLIYTPFRPRTNSPYGHAPLESILLNANTDLRFQLHFLQRFTDGNVPEAFASAPESWTPDQVEAWQEYWDSILYGDQSRKHQVRWMPGGSTFTWTNEKDFSDSFSLHMMRKTAAAYHVVPSDMGFTDSVNRSTGESQADVAHKVGDKPFGRFFERIITSFLQDDLGLPLVHQFDWGEEQDDRVQQANADNIYMKMAVVGASEIRQMRYGLPEPEGQAVPRVFFTERAGPIPLSALYDVAGDIDPATGAPKPGSTLPHKVFAGVEGTLPSNRIQIPSLAEQEYGETAMPMKPPPQPDYRPSPGPPPPPVVAKEAAALPGGGPTEGVISGTGIYSYDLDGQGDGEDDGDPVAEAAAAVAKAAAARAELGAFQRFARARRRDGRWRDFRFTHTGPVTAHRLNDAGRFLVLKAAGQAAVAGLAVRAAGTGRVLMLQRALDPGDPAGGTWEFPGGHIEDGESELQAAWREWAEETGCVPPPGEVTGEWAAGDGIYKGFVWTVESEDSVPVRGDSVVPNPDDPDGDQVEAIAWWDPGTLAGNPSVRAELAASLDDVMAALATPGPAQTIEPDGTE